MVNLIDELEREVAHSDFMAGMAHHWLQRAQDAEKALAIVVQAAGGRVIVSRDDLVNATQLELIKMYQDHDMTMHFITRRPPKTSLAQLDGTATVSQPPQGV